MMREAIEKAVRQALAVMGVDDVAFVVDYPPAAAGSADYATNAALAAAKLLGRSPREVADALRGRLAEARIEGVEDISIAGAGFINFKLSRSFFAETVAEALARKDAWGKNDLLAGKKIMVEYTDPNPFKEFHIGHLMTNTLGESVACLLEHSGAQVIRANYQGDVGPHVAKAIWGLQRQGLTAPSVAQISVAYVAGSAAYETDEVAKAEIDAVNKKVYDQTDEAINVLYSWGRKITLEHFEEIYRKLGTAFDPDCYFFESETGPRGLEIVHAHPELFVESDGAIVFHGEAYDPKLHTRVFINKLGLPTYETKELGLAEMKRERKAFDCSITVTATEQEAYFNVVFTALDLIHPEWRGVFEHIHHGMMRFAEGKMSSRKGNVITGESLLADMEAISREKMSGRELSDANTVASQVAVAAIKYAVLRQSSGKDIIFDPEKSLSLEGDSGPYLQYAHTRCASILRKAKEQGIAPATAAPTDRAAGVERLLPRFPEVVERAAREYEPHYVAQYLTELASEFNHWYATEQVLDGTPAAAYKLAVVDAVRQTLRNGLWLLGIKSPEEM